MKFIKFTIVVAVICLASVAYGQQRQQTPKAKADTTYMFLFEHDSKLSTKQKDLKYRLGELFMDRISVKDNQLTSDLTVVDFTKANLPSELYNMLRQNMDEVNRFVKANNVNDLSKAVEVAKKDFKRTLEKRKKLKE